MKRNIEFIVYLVGIVLLGLFYVPLKSLLGGGVWFVTVLVVLLLALRGIGILSRHVVERRGNS
jgi:hypothetical protein